MTEAVWLTGEDPTPMLRQLGRACNERKIRLFCCACCRLLSDGIFGRVSESAAVLGEKVADGIASDAERKLIGTEIRAAHKSHTVSAMWHYAGQLAFHTIDASNPWGILLALWARDAAANCFRQGRNEEAAVLERLDQVQPNLLRDIFGNPFRPVAFSPEWRTSTALALAREMYVARDFGAMPILADALQDAWCENADILNHCRDVKQVHVRGCWVVDLVLGKE